LQPFPYKVCPPVVSQFKGSFQYRAPTKRDGEGAPTNWGKVTENYKLEAETRRRKKGEKTKMPG